MPSPIAAPSSAAASLRGSQSVAPVATQSGTPTRGGTTGERSFAQLLADADAVRDLIDVRRRKAARPASGPGALSPGVQRTLQGALQGATALVARQPWLGLALLRRHAAATGHGQGRQAPAVPPRAGQAG